MSGSVNPGQLAAIAAQKLPLKSMRCYAWRVIALGIDPGTRNLGWGVVHREGNRMRHIAHGVIRLDGRQTLAKRLHVLDGELAQVIERFKPTVGSVESLFFHKDPQAAAKLGHARGVVLLAFARAGIELAEYPPARVKRTVTGRGQAEKKQVAMMIRAMLTLDKVPQADAADALAIAVTHLRLGPVLSREENRVLAGKVDKRRRRSPAAKR